LKKYRFCGVKNRNKESLEFKTVSEISCQNKILQKLSPVDAHRVGFISGANSILREKNEIKRAKNAAIKVG
jgi:hypothetical protein